MGVKTFNLGACMGDSKRTTVLFKGPENVYITFPPVPKQSLLLKHRIKFMKGQKSHAG